MFGPLCCKDDPQDAKHPSNDRIWTVSVNPGLDSAWDLGHMVPKGRASEADVTSESDKYNQVFATQFRAALRTQSVR